jgi:dTDP-4-amino-4,6-dideoxygalactose transaminase
MRRQNAEFYTSSLENSGISGGLVIAPKIVRERHVFNQYVIRAKKRDQLRDFLSKNGISTEIYYPVPMHLQECVNSSNWKTGDFPISERAASEVLALPIFPELTMEQKQHVVNSIISFYNS